MRGWLDSGRQRRWTPGHRPGFALMAGLVATAVAAVSAAASGAWTAATVLAVAFLVIDVVWSVPVWRRRAEERHLRRELAILAGQDRLAVAILVRSAVAQGRHSLEAISQDLHGADDVVEPVLAELERAALSRGSGSNTRGTPQAVATD